MKNLIINADDFGRHVSINQAVIQGFAHGCIRSASIMPNCDAFEDAVKQASGHTDLGIGVHFTLVGETPLLPHGQVSSLVGQDGKFYSDYIGFVKKFFLRKIKLSEIYAELNAQMQKVKRTGLTVTHIDSHQHMHVLPGVIDVVLAVARENNIDAIRIPKIPVNFTGGYNCSIGQCVGRTGLSFLAELAKWKAKKAGFRVPDYFSGIVAGEAVTEDCLNEIIDGMKNGVTEVMLHPGKNNALLHKDCGWHHNFEVEFQAVMSENILKKLSSRNIKLISFKDL